MAQKGPINTIIALAGLIIVLAVSLGGDRWIVFLRTEMPLSGTVAWAYVIADLVWAGMLLLLFWFVVFREPVNWPIGFIYLLVGLPLTLFPVLYLSPAGQVYGFLEFYLATSSAYLRTTGAFLTIIGGLVLVRSFHRVREEAPKETA